MNLTDKEFIEKSKKAIVDYFNSELNSCDSEKTISEDDVYVVWLVKVLQNNKGLFSTHVPDGMYYEVTYNGDTNQIYLDAYKRWKNIVINL